MFGLGDAGDFLAAQRDPTHARGIVAVRNTRRIASDGNDRGAGRCRFGIRDPILLSSTRLRARVGFARFAPSTMM